MRIAGHNPGGKDGNMSEYDAYLDSWHATYPKPAYDHIGLISWEELFGPSGLCPYSTAVDRIIYPKIMSCSLS